MSGIKSFVYRKKKMKQHIFLSITILVVLLFLLIPANGAAGQNQGPRNPESSGELIVKYLSEPGKASMNKSLRRMQAQTVTMDDEMNVQLIRLEKEGNLDEAIAQLEKDANVAYVEPNYIYRISSKHDKDPNDPYFLLQWGLDAVDVKGAWGKLENSPGTGIIVAVVDTGVDYLHPDLEDNVVTGYGKDFVNGNTAGDDADGAMDDNGHGTHVAGIIGAVSDNDLGITGVTGTNPVTILPIKVLDEDGEGTVFNIARGIREAADQGATVINLSLGGPGYSLTLAEAVAYAQKKGSLVVAAAGNVADVVDYYYPASLPGVLTVGAVEEDGNGGYSKAYFSNYGKSLDMVAPGVHILSTVPKLVYGMNDVELLGDIGDQGCYAYYDGTSMAAPFVSGVAALVKLAYPEENAGEIAARLQETAQDLGEGGWDPDYGYGLVQALSAVESSNPELAPIVFVSPAEGSELWGKIQLQTQVAYPGDVGAVKFYLNEKDQNHLLGQVNKVEEGQLFYNLTWDTNKAAGGGVLADGSYILIAQVVDAEGNPLGEDLRWVEVKNQVSSGLQFQVINPDGTPAQEAEVTVWYQNKELSDWDQSINGASGGPEYWYEWVYQGWTDSNGTLRVPGSWATDLNGYFALVSSGYEDSEGNWIPAYYVRQLEAPQNVLIDGSQAKEVTLQAQIFDSSGEQMQPMDGGEIWCNYQDENGISLGLPGLMGYLDDQGTRKAWLDPGFYGFFALDAEAGYYLRQEVSVPDQATVNFDLTNTARVNVDLKTPSDWAELYLYHDYFAPVLGMQVLDGQEIIVTAGSYSLGVNLFMEHEGENGPETWLYWLADEDWVEFSPGEHQIAPGGNIQLSWTFEQAQLVPGDYLYGDTVYQDGNGLVLWEVIKYLEDLSAEREGGITCRRPYGSGVAQPETYRWNEENRAWETAGDTAGDSAEIYPVLQVKRVPDGILMDEKDCESYYGFSYYLNPEAYDSGDYQAILSLDAGPLGYLEDSRDFSLGVSADDVILEITDPEGDPASEAEVSVYVWTADGVWEEVLYEDLDQDGTLRLPAGLGIQPNDRILITVSFLDNNEGFFLYRDMTGLAGPRILIDGTTARQVEITASYEENGIENMQIFATVFLPGEDDNLWPLTNYLGQTGENGVLTFWLDPGTYSVAGGLDGSDTVFYLNAPWTEISSGAGSFPILLDGDNTGEITPQLSGELSSVGFVPINNEVPYAPFLELNRGDKLVLTAGTYQMFAILIREDPNGLWNYMEEISGWSWDGNGQAVAREEKKTFSFGSNFSLGFSLKKDQVKRGDSLQGDVVLRDEYGNRVAGVSVNPSWYREEFAFLSLSSEGKLMVQNDRGKIKAESYNEIAPFLSIFKGEERIYHEKNTDYYLAASYLIPSIADAGSYRAQMALQIGPEGVIKDTKIFQIVADGPRGGGSGGSGDNGVQDGVDKEKVSKYFAAYPGAGALTVVAKDPKNPSVTIGVDGLKLLVDKGKGLVISGEKLVIEDLLSALDMEGILDLAGTDQDVEIKIEFGQQSEEESGKYVLSDGMHLVAGLNLEITVLVKGSAKGTFSTFQSPVKVSLQLTPEQLQGCNVDLLGVYYYNEETGITEYVGGTYDASSGKIRFETSHWSKYLVLEYEKIFIDFPVGHWAQNDVQVMVARHIVSGLSDTNFGPGKNISRAEFATLLVRTLGLESDSRGEEIFGDVPAEAWYANYVSAAYRAGLIQGSSWNTFSPHSMVTREEMGVMIIRALEYLEKMPEDQEINEEEVLKGFKDGSQVSHWALNAMAFVVTSGIMNGRTADILAPGGQASRAESVVILKRYMQAAGLL